MTIERPTTWTDWYRFACRTLELAPVEAAAYATARYVEQENRLRLRGGSTTGVDRSRESAPPCQA